MLIPSKDIYRMLKPDSQFSGLSKGVSQAHVLSLIPELLHCSGGGKQLQETISSASRRRFPMLSSPAACDEPSSPSLPVYCAFEGGHDRECEFRPVMTELGLCYGFNYQNYSDTFQAGLIR